MALSEQLIGTVFKNYYIINEIGRGAFGIITAARDVDSGQLFAIKFEDAEKQVLKSEVLALKKLQDCPNVCRLYSWGKAEAANVNWNYMVMALLGENLSELCKARGGQFNIITTLSLGVKMLSCLEQVHSRGFIHRDIKPSNFVIGLHPQSARRELYLIDFGLARRFVDDDGVTKASRDLTTFRGTARYASINSHMCRDLGCRDDLWSLFYLLVEFGKGYLPWKNSQDKDQIAEMKRTFNCPELVDGLPEEFLAFLNYLKSLEFNAKIDYAFLTKQLSNALSRYGGSESSAFGWENQAPAPRFLAAYNYAVSKNPSAPDTPNVLPSNPFSQPISANPFRGSMSPGKTTPESSPSLPRKPQTKELQPIPLGDVVSDSEATSQSETPAAQPAAPNPFTFSTTGFKPPPITISVSHTPGGGYSGVVTNFGAFGSVTPEGNRSVSLEDSQHLTSTNPNNPKSGLLSSNARNAKWIGNFANITESRVPDSDTPTSQTDLQSSQQFSPRETSDTSSDRTGPTEPTRSKSKSKSEVKKPKNTSGGPPIKEPTGDSQSGGIKIDPNHHEEPVKIDTEGPRPHDADPSPTPDQSSKGICANCGCIVI